MTVFAEANVDVDLRMLRSFRVLRPLKLVSRIPSKLSTVYQPLWIGHFYVGLYPINKAKICQFNLLFIVFIFINSNSNWLEIERF